MKFFHLIIALLTAGIFFSSCQKEYSAENGNSVGSLLSDSIGDCMPILVNGSYITDTALKASNYVEVQVNISQPGAYLIKSDTINGYSFTGSGAVSVAGISTVRLLGSGKPIGPSAADIFQVRYQSSACDFSVTVTGAGGGGASTARFTFGGSPGACTGAATNGTYTQGVATTAANTAVINVNVTTAGTYSITTGAVNGVTFTGIGTLAIGAQTITLTASGPPTLAGGPFTYPIAAGSSNCSFSVTYAPGIPPATYTINCTGATMAGTYQAGTATTTSNTVTISATSATPGSYNISTPPGPLAINGVSFSGSGSFPGPTTQPITLTANGTPAATGTFIYPATTTGGSTCSFSVTFSGAPPPPTSNIFRAKIGSATAPFTNFNVSTTGSNNSNLDILFTGDGASFEFIRLQVVTSGSPLVINTDYNVNQGTSGIEVYGDYTSSTGVAYAADTNGTIQIMPLTIRFSTISSTRIVGTFFGNMEGGAGTITFYSGEFDITF